MRRIGRRIDRRIGRRIERRIRLRIVLSWWRVANGTRVTREYANEYYSMVRRTDGYDAPTDGHTMMCEVSPAPSWVVMTDRCESGRQNRCRHNGYHNSKYVSFRNKFTRVITSYERTTEMKQVNMMISAGQSKYALHLAIKSSE